MKLKYFEDTDTLYIEFRAGRKIKDTHTNLDAPGLPGYNKRGQRAIFANIKKYCSLTLFSQPTAQRGQVLHCHIPPL